MRNIFYFLDFINEVVSKDLLAREYYPIKSFIGSVVNGTLSNVPVKALEEISNWKNIKKSPRSLSFYNNLNTRSDGTIRISDHWNYSRDGARTRDSEITKKWAKGVYDKKTDTYDIIEVYHMFDNNAQLVYNLGERLKEKYGILKHDNDLIKFRDNLSKNIQNGSVYYLKDGKKIKVRNMNAKNITILNGKFEDTIRYNFPFELEVDGEIYDSDFLVDKGVIKGPIE